MGDRQRDRAESWPVCHPHAGCSQPTISAALQAVQTRNWRRKNNTSFGPYAVSVRTVAIWKKLTRFSQHHVFPKASAPRAPICADSSCLILAGCLDQPRTSRCWYVSRCATSPVSDSAGTGGTSPHRSRAGKRIRGLRFEAPAKHGIFPSRGASKRQRALKVSASSLVPVAGKALLFEFACATDESVAKRFANAKISNHPREIMDSMNWTKSVSWNGFIRSQTALGMGSENRLLRSCSNFSGRVSNPDSIPR